MSRESDNRLGQIARLLWALLLKGFLMRYYVRMKIHGDFGPIAENNRRLILLSRHSSHLDGGAILAAIPFALWPRVYIGAAKDYFFTNRLSAFFFTHCMMAIPIDRTVNRGAAVTTCLKLLGGGEPAWLLLFPEGSRHKSEGAPDFKRGVSIFSLETDTPLLFLHLENRQNLWPPGRFFSFPGSVDLYVGPIHPPASIAVIQESYDLWIDGLQTELKFS